MSDKNMKLWDALRTPPQEALSAITGGRLKGMTDINPQWRYEALTRQFGPVGFGWKYEVVDMWTETGSNDQVCAFAKVALSYRIDDAWSCPVWGVGGSMLAVKEKNGIHTSDECFKMAVTDALSVACKMIGVAADIYMGDKFKTTRPPSVVGVELVDDDQLANIDALINEVGADLKGFLAYFNIAKLPDLPASKYNQAVKMLEAKR